jgi:hypothetical protein
MAMVYHFSNTPILQNLLEALKVFEACENCNFQGNSLDSQLNYTSVTEAVPVQNKNVYEQMVVHRH